MCHSEIIILFALHFCSSDSLRLSCLVQEATEAEPLISDDELPADVDLNDPFFAEELGATG